MSLAQKVIPLALLQLAGGAFELQRGAFAFADQGGQAFGIGGNTGLRHSSWHLTKNSRVWEGAVGGGTRSTALAEQASPAAAATIVLSAFLRQLR